MRQTFDWLQWDGSRIDRLGFSESPPETHVQPLSDLCVDAEVARICAIAPDLLQAVPHIAGKAISVRLRGIEIARVSEEGTTYPLGLPLESVIRELDRARRFGSRHALARAYEERWLGRTSLDDPPAAPSVDADYDTRGFRASLGKSENSSIADIYRRQA
jgi:hypothetical protein